MNATSNTSENAPRVLSLKPVPNGGVLVALADVEISSPNGPPHGIGLVHGAISGNSEVLDFDEPGLFEQYDALCRAQGYGVVLDAMPLIETPSGGRHLLYRCAVSVTGNQKLAETPERKTRIETRGEGGYTLGAGSPAECHSAGKPYPFLRGRPGTLPILSAEDRDALLSLAMTFNEYVEPSRIVAGSSKDRAPVGKEQLRPGDDYNARGDYEDLLTRHGWQRLSGGGDKGLWQRPGKTGRGLSATSNYGGANLLYVFSSNAAPFQPQTAYPPFAVYACLEHGGDFTAAARDLSGQGYGSAPSLPHASASERGDAEAPISQASPPAWEKPEPFTAYDLPAFPKEALPPALAGFVSEVAASVQVPYDMPAILGLGIVGAAGSRTCRVLVGTTHHETLNLYILVVGSPGERKSGMYSAMMKVLEEDEQGLRKAAEPLIAIAKEKAAFQEKRIAHLRDIAAKAKTDTVDASKKVLFGEAAKAPEIVPPLPRRLADDVTPEKLAQLLADNDGTMCIASAEGGIFGTLAGRYSDGMPNLDLFLKGKSGESVKVDRKNGLPLEIPCVCLSLLLTVQPDVLSSLSQTPSFRGRGLVGRFQYALPTSLVGTRLYQDRPIDAICKNAFESMLKAILSLTPIAAPAGSGNPENPQRHELCLNGSALNLWAEYADRIEKRQAEGGDLADIRDWASKLPGDVARIAGGFHLIENAVHGQPWTVPISVLNVERAWAIGEYFIPHAKAALGQMGAKPNVRLAKRVLRWIERTGLTEFAMREAHRAHQNVEGVSSVQDMIPPLSLLCERNFLREKPARPATGRPSSPVYEVNPALKSVAEHDLKSASE